MTALGRIGAVALDMSRLGPPTAIRGLDYESILAERLARLVELFAAAGVDYDVAGLETDPAVILQQADAYRELLALASINDALKSIMVAFARGADLDHLGARFGVARLAGEADEAFRRRVLLAPEAYAGAGPIGAYAFHALSADTGVRNVDVWSPSPGHVEIAVQAREGDGTAPEAMLSAVRRRVLRDDVKVLTDAVAVRSVVVIPYTISVVVHLLAGPDPVVVRQNVEAALAAMADARNSPARDVPLSAVIAAAHLGSVERVVVLEPAADVAMGRGETALCTSISVSVEVSDG